MVRKCPRSIYMEGLLCLTSNLMLCAWFEWLRNDGDGEPESFFEEWVRKFMYNVPEEDRTFLWNRFISVVTYKIKGKNEFLH